MPYVAAAILKFFLNSAGTRKLSAAILVNTLLRLLTPVLLFFELILIGLDAKGVVTIILTRPCILMFGYLRLYLTSLIVTSMLLGIHNVLARYHASTKARNMLGHSIRLERS